MPPPAHRRKAFSTKQRKEQLKQKREKKRTEGSHTNPLASKPGKNERGSVHSSDDDDDDGESESGAPSTSVRKMNQQPNPRDDKSYDPNRYRLYFLNETTAELEKRKARSMKPYKMIPEEELDFDLDDIYKPGTVLDMPKRPPWSSGISKDALEKKEQAYFKEYLDSILEKHNPEDLSYFELNLETWRQLWRVVEMADIVLLITDIRHPALHFSPAFYTYVTKELKKPLILVLNKIDLAPPALIIAWRDYFEKRFPDIHVIYFTMYPKDVTTNTTDKNDKKARVLQKKRTRKIFNAIGPQNLLKACQEIAGSKADLSSWREKIEGEGEVTADEAEHEILIATEESSEATQHVPYKDGILTIGCCGYTNVGKSSLMNGLMGKKVVSVSKTPGHTKHFQTIFLTPTVKLCDSPGLVFPSLVPKPMQILAGIYPVAQVREPYSAVQYLAERIDLPTLLNLQQTDPTQPWSAFDICDAWALKRGFLTAKAARSDVYRAANNLMRLATEGRICLCTRPPGYTQNKAYWENRPETLEIKTLLQSSSILDPLAIDSGSGSDEEPTVTPDEESGEDDRVVPTNNPFALLGDDD